MATETGRRIVLLFGARGQVGHELREALAEANTLISSPDVDFRNIDSLRAVVRQHRPDIIVNAAAYTAVDKAESEVELAFAVNAIAPSVLAEEAEALGACMIHYSTDYVFDGRKPWPYVETDTPNPLSVYGRSKLDGERGVDVCKRHLTFRTSWVIGSHGRNFAKTILQLGGEQDTLRVVDDQIGAPTSAALLSKVTAMIVRQMESRPASDARWGLYHLTAKGETSWYGLARHVIVRAIAAGLPMRVKPNAITPVTTADFLLSAMRPANSCLDTFKLCSTFGVTLPAWEIGVDDELDRLLPAMKA